MKKQQYFKKKLLVVATVAAVELMTSTASFSATSVTGITVDGTGSALVVGGGQLYENAATIGDTSATAAGATVWAEGVGNTINNSGTISRQSSTGSTYGVFLGDYSTARGDAANKAVAGADATSGAFGSTTMRITIPTTAGTNGLNATTLVGKQLVMAGVVIDGEARAGDTREIVSATAVSGSANTFDIVVNKAWARIDANGDPVTQVGNSYNLIAGSGLNILNNSGTISATSTATATATVRAVDTNIAGDYIINNAATGHIIGTHTSVGTPQGIDAGGDVTTMTVNNEGEIKAVRATASITLTSNKFNELKGTGGGITNQSIGSAAAIYSQEELESITINNASNGLIVGEGDLNPAIYMRAGTQSIVNDGMISGSENGANYGMAIGSVSDGGEVRTLNLQNTGTINGAVLGVNANAYRYYALSNFDGATANATSSNTNFATNRLLTNGSNWGQLDATIVNNEDATINGKVYLSNGAHTIVNHGTMLGGLDLDQRDTKTERVNNYDAGFVPGELGENTVQTAIVKLVKLSNADNGNSSTNNQTAYVYNLAASPGEYTTDTTGLTADNTYQYTATAFASSSTAYSGLFTVVGTKSFTLENAGTFTGDILVHTASSGALGHTVTSEVTLSPYVTGAGGTTADTATNNIHKFDGNLIVVSTSSAGGEIDDITIAPKVMSGTVVRSGQFYNVANGVKYGNTYAGAGVASLTQGSTDLPSGFSNGLVTWTPSINASGALVVGSEVEVAGVAGLHAKSKSALTALMSVDSELGSQIQNLETSEQVRKASEQLRPEINGATTQASMNVTGKLQDLVGSRLDQIHLASVAGRSGIATGDETRTADGTGVWMQAFGAKGSQDRRENTDGYNTQAYGFAVGSDQLVDDDTRVGFVGSYGQSTVNGLGDGTGNRTSIDSYQAALYGSTLLRKMYLNATLGLGYHDYTNHRTVLDNAIKGDHDAWQYSAKLEAGFPVKFNAVTLVPVASMAYSRLAEDSYKESGVGALSVKSRDTDSFRTGLGAKAMIPLIDNSVSAGLELRAIWNHEFADASIDTTARFVEGGASFTTKGVSLERDSTNLGASLRVSGVMDGVKQTLNLNYDAEVKSQYLNQTASLQARFDF